MKFKTPSRAPSCTSAMCTLRRETYNVNEPPITLTIPPGTSPQSLTPTAHLE
jgi:hypothetical protein